MATNAQTCLGTMTRNFKHFKKGESVMYMIDKGGKVLLEDAAEFDISAPSSYVKFSGYYVGEIIDPVDNYVNVRKGPGTNYPVVMKVYTKDWILDHEELWESNSVSASGRFYYQKTKTNWLKLYSNPGHFLGYIYKDRIKKVTCPEFF